MANQSPDRRRVLELIAKAAVASQFPGFNRWVFAAAEHAHAQEAPMQLRTAEYRPQFFDAHEYRTIEVLSEMIIPSDESPGANEAGVSEFIDFMAAHGDETLQKPMREGLRWLDRSARQSSGKAFLELPAEEQSATLKRVAFRNPLVSADVDGQAFFELIRRYTVMGYYTSRVGLQELGYPGLKFYSASPECPHKDDPEHRHLPPARF